MVADWIDRLARALGHLAKVQAPYLQKYWDQNPRVHVVSVGRDGERLTFPLDDLRNLYAIARDSKVISDQEHFGSLCTVLDPVRYILLSHPALESVVSRIVGEDQFWIQILNAGHSISLTDLIAGLMARAAELSSDSFQTAAHELNSFLTPGKGEGSASVPGGLDVGYDAVLFYGLTLKERIEIGDGMALLPFEQTQRFVDEDLVKELAPLTAGFNGWESVGAAVRPFRWRPVFSRTGYDAKVKLKPPWDFFRKAQNFLELLAVAHASPVLCLAVLHNCIDRSAGKLLGLGHHNGGINQRRSAQHFDGFDEAPGVKPGALAEAMETFESGKGGGYGKMAPIIGMLAEALARNGRFEDEDRIVDVARALERMYDLPGKKIARTLQNRASQYLETDEKRQTKVKENVKEFYDARSDIVHSRRERVSPQRNRTAFVKGFDIARRSLFKLLREGPPDNWLST